MSGRNLTLRQVLVGILSGGVDAIPLVGGLLSKFVDLADPSAADEVADLRLALDVVRARLGSHGHIIEAITKALPEVPQACRSNLEFLQHALENPDSPPEEFASRLEAFVARFDSVEKFAEEAKAILADHERRLVDHEDRIGSLEGTDALPSAEVVRLLDSARQKDQEAIAELARQLNVAEGAINAFLAELGHANIPPENWPAKLMELAREHRELRGKFSADPDRAVQQAIDAGDFDLADRMLAERCAEQDVQKGLTLERRADLAKLRLRYRQAAELCAQAAALLPDDSERRLALLRKKASVLYDQGREFGDNDALRQTIDLHRKLLSEASRSDSPLDWAKTQNNLGCALQTLGERESGTKRLEEAVTAYRLALEERTRDRVPLDWAATQNNLGNALQTLGERESGTERLEEAVKACRLALEERTRDRVPLDWATTQNNLGNALANLGERESGTERLEEAVTAYRLALEERTRDRVPLDWAMTQNNLGIALGTLGERESGTERLEEAVKAYRLALEERTRDRAGRVLRYTGFGELGAFDRDAPQAKGR